jgi:hypothetical protein
LQGLEFLKDSSPLLVLTRGIEKLKNRLHQGLKSQQSSLDEKELRMPMMKE